MSTSGATLRYKGYVGSINASIEDNCLHGRLQHIDDVITYEGQTVAEVKAQFESAVDEYLEHCASIGKDPERQYSGTFNVRVGFERHRWIVQYGSERNLNVNEVVCLAVDSLQNTAEAASTFGQHEIAAFFHAKLQDVAHVRSTGVTTWLGDLGLSFQGGGSSIAVSTGANIAHGLSNAAGPTSLSSTTETRLAWVGPFSDVPLLHAP